MAGEGKRASAQSLYSLLFRVAAENLCATNLNHMALTSSSKEMACLPSMFRLCFKKPFFQSNLEEREEEMGSTTDRNRDVAALALASGQHQGQLPQAHPFGPLLVGFGAKLDFCVGDLSTCLTSLLVELSAKSREAERT